MENTVLQAVKDVGFPIAVAAWALYQSHLHEVYLQDVLKTSLEKMTAAIDELRRAIGGDENERRRSENDDQRNRGC